MKQRKTFMKTTAVLLFCTVLIGCAVAMPAPVAQAETSLTELENQLSELGQKKEEIDKQLAETRKDKKTAESEQNLLKSNINTVQSQINTLGQKINLLNQQIAEKDAAIAETQKKVDENYELLKKRVKAMYMSDDASMLSVLFGSSSFADFLSVAETMSRVTEHDQNLIQELKEQKQQIETDKATIEASKADIEASYAQLSTKNSELNQAMAESNSKLSNLEQLEAKMGMSIKELEKAEEKLQAEIEAYIRQNQGAGELSPGNWLWPLSGYYRVSSYFGPRQLEGAQQYHSGIDIPAPAGTPVRASKSGVVIQSGWWSTYGNAVTIDHGGGYVTIYAHNSSLNVVKGQTVVQGQVIAGVGTTGWSYGNHCHFEVRVNGVRQDPLRFVQQPG